MFTIYPAIDIYKGRCVRLFQGKSDQETVYFKDPVDAARLWIEGGAEWLHVIDLDGAFSGKPGNLAAIAKIAELGIPVQLGGGMRNQDTISTVLDLGVSRVVIGTSAIENPAQLRTWLKEFTPDRIAVGLDAKQGQLAVRGWVQTTNATTLAFARNLESWGVRHVIHTDIATDGAMQGPNLAQQKQLAEGTDLQIIASGGVSTLDDIKNLYDLSQSHPNLSGVIVGKALYEKQVNVPDMIAVTQLME